MNPEKKALNDISLLYVEDEEYTLEAVGELLKNKVNEINLAKNGREGLHFFKERYPDIVVTDIRMPVMSGLEMAREIRSLSPRTEIIVTSAHDDTRFLLDAIDLNISQYVMKPIAKERLFSAVDRSARKIFLERMGEEKKEILEELVQDRTTELKKTGEALDTSLKKLKKE
jgi:YesN/AraC family two-component response regulator